MDHILRKAWLSAATLPLLALFFSQPALAQTQVDTTTRDTNVRQVQRGAAEWGITVDDYYRYQELMSGTRGVWSPDGDPLMVLGAHAQSSSERRRFAELFVRKEYERVVGELEFQKAVDQAWKRLFPQQQRVELAPGVTKVVNDNQEPVRFALVVEPECTRCVPVVRSYVQRVAREDGLQALDIYIRETSGDDSALRAFVDSAGIPVELIRANRVTINHGEAYSDGAVPAVWMLNESGTWSVVE